MASPVIATSLSHTPEVDKGSCSPAHTVAFDGTRLGAHVRGAVKEAARSRVAESKREGWEGSHLNISRSRMPSEEVGDGIDQGAAHKLDAKRVGTALKVEPNFNPNASRGAMEIIELTADRCLRRFTAFDNGGSAPDFDVTAVSSAGSPTAC